MKLKITRDTFLKLDPTQQASDLPEASKAAVEAGTVYSVASYLWRGNYIKVALKDATLNGKNTWYCFGQHCQLLQDDGSPALPKRVQLSVGYRSQLDNDTTYFGDGIRQCHLTSVVMWLNYITNGKLTRDAKANGFNEPESLYGSKLARYGDTTNPYAHTDCLKECFAISSEFRQDLTKNDLIKVLANGKPIPLGVAWSDSGHWVCAVGYDGNGIIVHDPYGIRTSVNSYDVGADGSFNHYSWNFLNQIYWDRGSGTGWGRLLV